MFFVYYGTDQYWPPWCLLAAMGVMGVWAARKVPSKVPLLGPVFLWVSFNALTLVEYKPALDYPGIDKAQNIAVKNLAATSYLEFLLLAMFFAIGYSQARKSLLWAFYLAGLLHALVLIYDQAWLHLETGTVMIGLLGNRSIGASFTVVWIFLTLHLAELMWNQGRKRLSKALLWSTPLGTAAVLVSKSGISYAALIVATTGAGLSLWPEFWVGVVLNAVLLVGLGTYVKPQWWTYFTGGPHAAAGRYEAWPMFYHFWHSTFPWWFGSGLGTFKFWGPVSQMLAHYQEGRWWLWAHSDWFQILFELGAIGLLLALGTYLTLLFKAKTRPGLFAALLAYGSVMVGNYPFHIAPFALLGWVLVFETGWGDACTGKPPPSGRSSASSAGS